LYGQSIRMKTTSWPFPVIARPHHVNNKKIRYLLDGHMNREKETWINILIVFSHKVMRGSQPSASLLCPWTGSWVIGQFIGSENLWESFLSYFFLSGAMLLELNQRLNGPQKKERKENYSRRGAPRKWIPFYFLWRPHEVPTAVVRLTVPKLGCASTALGSVLHFSFPFLLAWPVNSKKCGRRKLRPGTKERKEKVTHTVCGFAAILLGQIIDHIMIGPENVTQCVCTAQRLRLATK